jgi:hypothetical protein
MWIGNQICFASDRDGTLNLYSYDVESQKVEQLTKSTDWDVRWPSKGENGEIVYEGGGSCTSSTRRRARTRAHHRGAERRRRDASSRVSAADRIEGVGSARRASACSSSRAATCSARRSRRVRRGT